MAARGLLMPLHVHTKTTASPTMVMIPTIISRLRNFSCTRRARFFCSHGLADIDMSMYREKFAQKMAMAGLKPHHRIAMAVSGGPDSIALCILAAGWKSDNFDAAANGRSKFIDGLLAIVVDHGLRKESAEEANLVYHRITDMGIKCEVACCEWLDGRPKLGHLQEAARSKRYQTLQNICIQQQIGILLTAHHADDQAELFILRLSRNSGILGLAGMAFTSQMFPEFPDIKGEGSKTHGIILVRPLLEFSKEDMYNICQAGYKKWVEDPTNRSPLYARNRIRMSLFNLSSPVFKAELQAVISACRRTRLHVDNFCHLLLNQAVTIMPHGYAVIDLGNLHSMEVKDIYLAKFAALVLQFISQRHRPVRGNASKLLLSYLRTFPCKTCLTVAGCYLCPAPGSKGTKVLVCCSVNSSLPPMIKSFHGCSYGPENCIATSELEQIITESEAYLDRFLPDASSVPFLDMTSSECVLTEAEKFGILSHCTHRSIVSLQKEESENFKSKAENLSDVSKDDVRSSGAILSQLFYPGQMGYFMNRFVLDWKICSTVSCNALSTNEVVAVKELGAEGQCFCSSCITGNQMVAEVRHMIDTDWIYLSNLSKKTDMGDTRPPIHPYVKTKQLTGTTMDYAVLSAREALVSLKSIPVAARRAMPVLVNAKGVLLSIPSIGFSCCPHLMVSAVFNPRVPLGGGHSSFL
ncbi:tRNA(Ile)-lysidine synthase [Sesamum alatum]|uniref:tRNA(Ile)-lysidine synthetase n=1 Tax=Sesamum alatum TaxID=300844 RepID=A0AAE2CAY3_9LAMI|nr:tRNA(Ile)-lysidine synthase [Sesamum alatum]